MAKLVSKTYGEALFELAVEEHREEEFLSEITQLKGLLSDNPQFEKLMTHPQIPKDEKLKVIDEVFTGRLSGELQGFLHLIVSKDRYGELDEILNYFIHEVKKQKGIGIAYVTTAGTLSQTKKKEVEAKLLEITPYRQMEMHYQVDEELIGGMVIRIGDRVVDGSVKNKLFELQRQLLKVQL